MAMTSYENHLAQRGPTDTVDLDAAAQFKEYFRGPRIKVQCGSEPPRFGTVGMTTGTRPAFLLMHRSNDMGSSDVLGPNDHVVAVKCGSRYCSVWNW
jgi:hypothetical protein